MSDENSSDGLLELELAFAHAALDHPTVENLERARRCADEVLRRLQLGRLTLGEAQRTLLLAAQLRTVLSAVDERRGDVTL